MPCSLSWLAHWRWKAQAQNWPEKPITFVVPFAAGGGTDAFASTRRTTRQPVGDRVLIENRAGAGGTVGASQASKAAPDGYTFFVGAAHHAIAPAIYPNLDYNLQKDFIAVALIARPPQVIVVNPARLKPRPSRVHNLSPRQPGQAELRFGRRRNDTSPAGELFKILTKTRIQHVPYRGAGPAMADLVAGHVPLVFDGLGSSAPQIRGGQLRALAVAAPKRVPGFRCTHRRGSRCPGFEVSTWYGVFAPKNTPPAIVERMTKELQKAMQTATIKDAWEKNGSDVPDVTGAAFATMVAAETVRWQKVVTEAGVKLD
jgi:tripartite-type tricarboxylate transporter receptor subunit TctC